MSEGQVPTAEAPAAPPTASGATATPLGVAPAAADASAAPVVPAPVAPAWVGELSEANRALVSVKGWDGEGKTFNDVVDGYRHLEGMRGVSADKLTQIPEWSNAEQVTKFNQSMGIPDSAEGYEKLDVQTTLGTMDSSILQGAAHALELRPDQHVKLAEWAKTYFEGVETQRHEQNVTRDTAEELELTSAWGAAKDENFLAASRTRQLFGITDEQVDKMQTGGMGYKATMELLAKVGRGLGEHKRADSDPSANEPFGLTPDTANVRLTALTKDKGFQERLTARDASAVAEWDNLKKIRRGGGDY